MRYLVLLASFMVLALLELSAQAAPPVDLVDQVTSGLDVACQPALPAPEAGELYLAGNASPTSRCFETVAVADTAAYRAPGVLRLLCFQSPSSDTNCRRLLVSNTASESERYLGDIPPPRTCQG